MTATNVDAAEVAKFEALSGAWWDPNGAFRTLHEINPLRSAYIASRVELAGRRVLDVGCGGGLLAEALTERGARVTGIDLAPDGLEAARAHAALTGSSIEYHLMDAEALAAQSPAAFDVVTCLELLEHVPQPSRLVRDCAALIKPGGSVFFSTINRNLRSFVLAIVAAEHALGLVPRGTHEYARLIRPAELARWCRAAKLDVIDLTGLQFKPLSGRHRLGGRPAVNYLCHAIRPATS